MKPRTAAIAYLAITVVMTWPVAAGLGRDLPSDLGDPAFVCWALARAADHWLALLSGDFDAIRRFWHAGLFHPEPFATAYSEHFAAHALQVLPVWAVTRNVILCYNLLFLSTYVLCGLGMFLLVRDLTGDARVAFVAGLAFAFAPYRAAAAPHLHVLSMQWMPFALFGLRRHAVTGRWLPLAGAAGAMVMQSLASGYYLLFFAPIAAAWVLVLLGARRLAQWRTWVPLVVAGGLTLAVVYPFTLPYAALQERFGHYRRPVSVVDTYSANLQAWMTAPVESNVWGWLRTLPLPEGTLFPGLTLVLLAVTGAVLAMRSGPPSRRVAIFAVVVIGLAVWLACGPAVRYGGDLLPIPPLYMLLYEYVPGFDLVRVPARLVSLALLMAPVLAGFALVRIGPRHRPWVVALAGVAFLVEGAALPYRINSIWTSAPEYRVLEARVYPEDQAPAVYKYLATLPADTVVAHLPFGVVEREIRYMYYSAPGDYRMINGYSGAFPGSYLTRLGTLTHPLDAPAAAWQRLTADGVTVVVVHTNAWVDARGHEIVEWLLAFGATRIGTFGDAVVLNLPER